MKLSWTLARVAGIPVRVHATLLLLLLWIASASALEQGSTWQTTAFSILFAAGVFLIVTLHELGHALAARHFGIRTRDILLLPIGGVASLERFPKKPWQEIVIALAGPAVNVALAATLGLLAFNHWYHEDPFATLFSSWDTLVGKFFWANVVMAGFNLIPAFPLDGGRVLRAFLALFMSRSAATRVAGTLGQIVALLLGLIGLYGNAMLVLVALFIWFAARSETEMTEIEERMAEVPVEEICVPLVHSLDRLTPIADATESALRTFQSVFPVLEHGAVVGLVHRRDLLAALRQGRERVAVEDIMSTHFPTIPARATVADAMDALARAGIDPVPVVRGHNEFVGLVTWDLAYERAQLGDVTLRSFTYAIHR